MHEDYYKVLGISKDASQEDIQKAYRTLARKLHPDLNPDDPDAKKKFQKMQEAYEVLGNPEKKQIYDQYGAYGEQYARENPFQYKSQGHPFGAGPFGAGGGSANWSGKGKAAGFNIDDILQMFGTRSGGGRPQGDSFDSSASQSANSAFQQYFDMGMNGEFNRTASSPNSSRKQRSGTDIQQTMSIPFTKAIEGGKASLLITRPNAKKPEEVTFSIPPGIESGKKIRLRELGNPSTAGGRPGDIIITIHVEQHPQFHRVGKNLYLTVPITLKEAVFGGKIDIPSPQGLITMTVPPNSNSGQKLRLKGFGVPMPSVAPGAKSQSDAGDLIAELIVSLPATWSEQDKELLKKMELKTPIEVRHHLHW